MGFHDKATTLTTLLPNLARMLRVFVLILSTGLPGSVDSQVVLLHSHRRPSSVQCFVNDSVTLPCEIRMENDQIVAWYYSPNSSLQRIKVFDSSVGLAPGVKGFNFSVLESRDLYIAVVRSLHTGTYTCEKRPPKLNESTVQSIQLFVHHGPTATGRHLEKPTYLVQCLGISGLIALIFVIVYKAVIAYKLGGRNHNDEAEKYLTKVTERPPNENDTIPYAID